MGCCLAQSALELGHEVIVISGPVTVEYPHEAFLVPVVSTSEMLEVCRAQLPTCDGVIGAAAPCDYRPVDVADHKIRKTGESLELKLVETEDVMATLGRQKRPEQWSVGFALETEDARFRALSKLQRKSCDLVVLNGAEAINSERNEVEIIAPDGSVIESAAGSKSEVARRILKVIQRHLIRPTSV